MVSAGVGHHLSSLPDPVYAALQILKWNTIYQVVNVIGAFSTKLSIGLFLLRLNNTRIFNMVIWIVLTPLAMVTFALVLTDLLQCIPLQALWNPSVQGHCISEQVPLTVSYVQSAFAILTDLFLTASPVIILWKVKINLQKQLAICALMSLGLMATIANALRNAFIPDLTQSDLSCE